MHLATSLICAVQSTCFIYNNAKNFIWFTHWYLNIEYIHIKATTVNMDRFWLVDTNMQAVFMKLTRRLSVLPHW